MRRKPWTFAVFAAIVVLIVGACTPAASNAPTGAAARRHAGRDHRRPATQSGGEPTTAAPSLNLPAVPTGYTELDKALGADMPYKGLKVSLQTQWTGGEAEGFAAAIADFQAATGIAVQIDSIGSSHETVLKTRVDGGQPPDMSQIAQPTAVLAYADDKQARRRRPFMDKAKLNAEFPSTIGLTTEGDHIWSIPTKADVKSMIWYPVKAFAAKGYAVPKTWDELVTLADKIKTDNPGQLPVLRQRRWPRHGDGLGAHGLDRGSSPQDRGSAGHQRLDQPQDPVLRPEDQGRLRQGWLAPVQGRLRRRRRLADREQRPQDRHGSDVRWRHPHPGLLDAEDPRLVRPGLLPGQAHQRRRLEVHDRRRRGHRHHAVPDHLRQFKGAEGSADSFMVFNERPEVRALAEISLSVGCVLVDLLVGWVCVCCLVGLLAVRLVV